MAADSLPRMMKTATVSFLLLSGLVFLDGGKKWIMCKSRLWQLIKVWFFSTIAAEVAMIVAELAICVVLGDDCSWRDWFGGGRPPGNPPDPPGGPGDPPNPPRGPGDPPNPPRGPGDPPNPPRGPGDPPNPPRGPGNPPNPPRGPGIPPQNPPPRPGPCGPGNPGVARPLNIRCQFCNFPHPDGGSCG